MDQERGDALVLGHRYDGSLDLVAAGFFGLDELGEENKGCSDPSPID